MNLYLIQTDNYWCAFDLGDPKGDKSVGIISRVDEKTGITDVLSTLDEHGIGLVAELHNKLEAAESCIARLRVNNRILASDSIIKQDRIAQFETREVKLPERYDIDMWPEPAPHGEWFACDDVLAALSSAGVNFTEKGE
ncbi:hypothetical protein JFN84_19930 [Enterobacter hormaechei subsp. xiangfangensis]|uniref:hypothetical protein n=1 Tax=Enterobacter hormaechei TaxID=158836 RepID=UPI001EFA3DCC|nr:hypothetical protein [Enterobacter hormaechei]ULQ21558.1 hypothetical protein JFN84_19930 [Enterobacter hormaechei subsp. xiangfangensis]ULQ27271.1 hypothetical protein JFN83_02560 [Enterobacter hormaechei subsp. xiangfangensis]ULQ32181.1 hypothetical protein JFN85_02665 [Enterobacter hormaechei subsp. xiangfangensis]